MTKRRPTQDASPLVASRFLTGSVTVMGITALLLVRLWYIQVYRGSYYVKISENNRIRRIEVPAPRGMIFDRHGKILLGNRPFYDLVYIPQYVKAQEKTLKILSNLIHEPISSFKARLRAFRGQPKFLPVTLKRNLTSYEVSLIESNKIFLPGIDISTAPRRDYNADTPAHIVGYLSEINAKRLKKKNEEDPSNPYYPGDLIGMQGLEAFWEKTLRGQRGYRLIQVDAFGRQTRLATKEVWELPDKPARPGSDLTLTIDRQLQKVVTKAFRGKFGAVIVMNPQNGEILAMLSSPSYDPTIYQEGISYDKWMSLIKNPFKPLYDKTTGGVYAPGSLYKPVVALAALEEGLLEKRGLRKIHCPGHFELGRDVFHCWQRSGHGMTDLNKAMLKSCDVYFYNLGVELGVDRIAKYARALGMGTKLGVRLNREDSGLIPDSRYKKSGSRTLTVGDLPPLSIGQGANLLTPIQIANLYATIANGGTIYRPYLVKRATSHVGTEQIKHKPEIIKKADIISKKSFDMVSQALEQVVANPQGTGRRAFIPGISVAGKTASVQVVSLKKNRNRKSVVSMKWQEHAMFAAFSPVKNAEVVVAVISENDQVGGGGLSCAPIARKILKAYWDLKAARQGTRPQQKDLANKPAPNNEAHTF